MTLEDADFLGAANEPVILWEHKRCSNQQLYRRKQAKEFSGHRIPCGAHALHQRHLPLPDFVYKDDADYYNPNEGYEPYWPDGEWVFELPRDRDLNASTTKWPLVCGEECIYLYTRIGKVCGHVSDDVTYSGCTKSFCSGWYVDDLTGGFKTFDTYCNFLDVQCRNKFYSRLIFVHVGECMKQQDLWYKPLFTDNQPVSRYKSYLSSLYSVLANITETPFG